MSDKLAPRAAAAAAVPEKAAGECQETGTGVSRAADRDSAQQLAARLAGALLRLDQPGGQGEGRQMRKSVCSSASSRIAGKRI